MTEDETMAHEPPRRISLHLARLFGWCDDSSENDGNLLERFRVRQDPEAFAALMRRHGSLVLGVCRRVLGDAHEAEDAFQATFLLLVRKTASIRNETSVASWLARVAYRLALAARIRAERRRQRERRVARREEAEMSDPASRGMWAVLDEELNRLPEKYHAPLVLCYLQGKTGNEAAQELGWPVGTVAGRLARARELLRGRLSRRGVMLGSGVLSVLPSLPAHAAALVSPDLMQVTSRNALHVALNGTGSALSTEVAFLLDNGMSMLRPKLKIALLATLTLGIASVSLVMAGAARRPIASANDGAPEGAGLPAAANPGDGDDEPPPAGVLARIGSNRFAISQWGNYGATFSPSGRLAAAADWGNAIPVWDAATGREVHRLPVDRGDTAAVAFTVDEKALVSIGTAKLRRWDMRTGRLLTEHPVTRVAEQASRVRAAFSPDAGKVACAANSGPGIRVYDAASGAEIQQLDGDARGTYALAFTPDGKALVSSGSDRMIRLWDLASGKAVRQFGEVPPEGHKYAFPLAISPDGKSLAAVRGGKEPIVVWDVATGAQRYEVEPQDQVVSLAFTIDGKALIYGCRDSATIHLCEAATGKAGRHFKLARGHSATVAIGADGKTLLSPGDTRLHAYDVGKGEEAAITRGPQGRIWGVAFSPDSKTLATAGCPVTLWNISDCRELRQFGRELRQFPQNLEELGPTRSVAFSPNGRYLAWAKSERALCLWDVTANREARELKVELGGTFRIEFASDGKTLAATVGNTIYLWDVDTGQVRHRLAGIYSFAGLALAPDGKTVATVSADRAIHLWNVTTGKERTSFPGLQGDASSLSFSPDGNHLLVAGDETKVRCLAVADGKETQSFDTAGMNTTAAMSSDGKLVVVASHKDSLVRVWDRATGKELPALHGHRGTVLALAFSADGKYLASAGAEGSALIWDVKRLHPK